jgi:hypothetical protein
MYSLYGHVRSFHYSGLNVAYYKAESRSHVCYRRLTCSTKSSCVDGLCQPIFDSSKLFEYFLELKISIQNFAAGDFFVLLD